LFALEAETFGGKVKSFVLQSSEVERTFAELILIVVNRSGTLEVTDLLNVAETGVAGSVSRMSSATNIGEAA